MAENPRGDVQPKQRTKWRKKGAKPIETPVPKREDVFRDLEKLAGKQRQH